jgi:hypothetical protein
MENQEKDEEHKKGDAIRFVSRAKTPAYLALGGFGFTILAAPFMTQGIAWNTVELPPAEAYGALASFSTGTTAAAGVFHYVADTTIDQAYEARFARLAPEVEQGGSNGPEGFQLTPRSS